MRWERLFADLEAAADDDALLERDALVSELRDEEWSKTSWRELLAGHVELDVVGAGRVAGETRLVNEHLVRLVNPTSEHVVSVSAVASVTSTGSRIQPAGPVESRLRWRSVLRRMRDDGDDIRLTRTDGTLQSGRVSEVLADAVSLQIGHDAAGRTVLVPFSAIAVVTLSIRGR